MNLTDMTDDVLYAEAVRAINAAAVGESRGGDTRSYDHAMDLMRESHRRLVAAGHDSRCEDDLYTRAWRQATADHAGRQAEPTRCTCGASS